MSQGSEFQVGRDFVKKSFPILLKFVIISRKNLERVPGAAGMSETRVLSFEVAICLTVSSASKLHASLGDPLKTERGEASFHGKLGDVLLS